MNETQMLNRTLLDGDSVSAREVPLRFIALATYLLFVWGLAYVKQDYLWIVGDDPNLLQQALLMGKGFIPNIDFFSGYPGLSLQLQAKIFDFVGYQPVSQHVYTALLASLFGLVLFWTAKNVAPWIILLFLLFSYSQGHLLNPSPNPGFLFCVAFVVGLKKSFDFFASHRQSDALIAGTFFSVAFLAKQYGVFGPIGFFIASTALVSMHRLAQKGIFAASLILASGFILYIYLGRLVPNGGDLLPQNALLFFVPTLAGLISVLICKDGSSGRPLSISAAIKANLIVAGSFLLTTVAYFLLLYGTENLYEVVREIMILVPKKINEYFVPVVFSVERVWELLYALLILFVPFMLHTGAGDKREAILHATMAACVGLLLYYSAGFGLLRYYFTELSPAPFATAAIIVVVATVLFFSKTTPREQLYLAFMGSIEKEKRKAIYYAISVVLVGIALYKLSKLVSIQVVIATFLVIVGAIFVLSDAKRRKAAHVVLTRFVSSEEHRAIYHVVLAVFTVSFLFASGNLSATPFVVVAFVTLVAIVFFVAPISHRKVLLAILAGFSPSFLILTPYPNYSYHIPIVVFGTLLAMRTHTGEDSSLRARLLSDYIPLIAIALVVWDVLASTRIEMNHYENYVLGDMQFRSGDRRWAEAINETLLVEKGEGSCTSYACRYLVLIRSPKFIGLDADGDPSIKSAILAEYVDLGVIERPIHWSPLTGAH